MKRILVLLLTLSIIAGTMVIIPISVSAKTTSITGVTPNEGKGTETAPYLIDTKEELQGMRLNLSAWYKLKTDITLNTGNESDWATNAPKNQFTPIGSFVHSFTGHFDGNGKTISGLYINESEKGGGLFDTVGDNAVISNFGITNSYIKSVSNVGSVTGRVRSGNIATTTTDASGNVTYTYTATGKPITISNIYSDAIVDGGTTGNGAGGIIGGLTGGGTDVLTVDSCVFAGSATANNWVGGIVGNGNARPINISDCLNAGTVTGNTYVSGIIGRNDATTTVTDCINVGKVNATGTSGITGIWAGKPGTGTVITLTNCLTSEANVYAKVYGNGTVNATNTGYMYEKYIGSSASVFEGWTARTGDVMIPTAVSSFISSDKILYMLSTVSGAAVRLSAPTDLRFTGIIGKSYLDSLIAIYGEENVNYGIIITPTDYIKTEFTIDALEADNTITGEKYLKINATAKNAATAATDGYYLFNGVVSNIQQENYNRNFSAIVYIEINNRGIKEYIYSGYNRNINSRNVKSVASAALNDTSDTHHDEYQYEVTVDASVRYSPYTEAQMSTLSLYIYGVNPENFAELYPYNRKLTRKYTVGEDIYDITCNACEYAGITQAEYIGYTDMLKSGGYTVYADNGAQGIDNVCYQTTLFNTDYTVNVTYYVATGEMYVTVEQFRELSPLQIKPENEVYGTDAKLYLPEHPTINGNYKFGESDIFRLSNNHFVIVDGAQEFSAQMTVEYLENLVGNGETPIVDAWFLTHAHPDHIYCLWGIGRDADLVGRIKVNGFYYTWPNDSGMRKESDYQGLLKQVANLNSVLGNFRADNGEITPCYKLHGGMCFYIGELEVQVLMTQDQLMPDEYRGAFNDSSTSFRFIVHSGKNTETTFLILGDAYVAVCDKLMQKYGYNTLHTDYFFSMHHGQNDYIKFFQFIAPDNIVYTAPSLNPKNKSGYAWLDSNTRGQYCAPCIIEIS